MVAPLGDAMLDHLHVLVVEDDRDVSDMVRRVLEDLGCRVTTASNAAGARSAIATGGITVTLLDALLPGEPGTDLADELARRGIPVVLMSGDLETIADARCSAPFLAKPFAITELVHALRSALAPIADPC